MSSFNGFVSAVKRSGEKCEKNSLGVEHCEPNVSTAVKLAFGFGILGLMIVIGLVWYFVKRSRTKKADAAAMAATAPQMSYAQQPSSYDPNAPQQYPFNGYEGGQAQAPAPTYAAPMAGGYHHGAPMNV